MISHGAVHTIVQMFNNTLTSLNFLTDSRLFSEFWFAEVFTYISVKSEYHMRFLRTFLP